MLPGLRFCCNACRREFDLPRLLLHRGHQQQEQRQLEFTAKISAGECQNKKREYRFRSKEFWRASFLRIVILGSRGVRKALRCVNIAVSGILLHGIPP